MELIYFLFQLINLFSFSIDFKKLWKVYWTSQFNCIKKVNNTPAPQKGTAIYISSVNTWLIPQLSWNRDGIPKCIL